MPTGNVRLQAKCWSNRLTDFMPDSCHARHQYRGALYTADGACTEEYISHL